jgi:hypothetical protein
MRSYPLPYGNPIHITDSEIIKQKLNDGENGFICFYLKKKGSAIKNNQIPFIPDYDGEIKLILKGRLLLHTRLFDIFKKKYKNTSGIHYTEF